MPGQLLPDAANEGWFVNIPWSVGFVSRSHHLTPSRGGAWRPTALCGEEGRAWQAVKLNPCLERVPRCLKCVGAAESSTDQREQPQPTPPRVDRSPRRHVYRRVVI